MIKVFQVIPSLGIGGAEKIAIDIAHNINKQKYNLTLVSLYDNDYTNYNDLIDELNICSLGKKNGFDFKVFLKLTKLIIKEKPDVIHTHLYAAPYTFLGSILAGTKVKIHTIHSVAEKELPSNKRRLMRFAYKFLGYKPVAISKFVGETIIKEYSIKKSDIIYIENGIDTSIFSCKKNKKDNDTVYLINVARFCDVKNHQLMISAFNKALSKNFNLKLILVGDGPLRSNIIKQVDDLNISDKVILRGVQEDVQNELNQADIFILTSKYEGLPLSLLEAMSCNLPIICTDIRAVEEIVINDYNGIIANADVESLSNAILQLSLNREKRTLYGNNSAQIAKRYDIKDMVLKYERVYNQEKL